MPIKLADDLLAFPALEAEGVMVIRETDAIRQDIRPLRIGLLNLMPDKARTEIQIARLIGATPLQVEMTLVKITDGHNSPLDRLISLYRYWEHIKSQRFDGFIITGTPVEHLSYEEVPYWNELRRIFDWTQTNVHRCLNICWAAQAAMYHFHGIPKQILKTKAFGVFKHRNLVPSSLYLQGFSDDFSIPVARWSEVRRSDISAESRLIFLADSEETGLCLVHDADRRSLHMFNHVEYDTLSLRDEYFRDRERIGVPLPQNYFPNNDLSAEPSNSWRSHAHLLFGNWINEIYQTTPFDIEDIGTK